MTAINAVYIQIQSAQNNYVYLLSPSNVLALLLMGPLIDNDPGF